jgi:hypothetical protein
MLERKITFKLPPTTIRDVKLTQEARRSKARCSLYGFNAQMLVLMLLVCRLWRNRNE